MLERPFPNAKRIAVDIETDSLDWRTGKLVLIVLSDGEASTAIRPHAYPNLGDWLRHDVYDREIVIHNAAFDTVWLDAKLGCGFPERVWDTMVCEQLLTAGLDVPASLTETAQRRAHVTLNKDLQTSFDGGEITEEQFEYARQDTEVLIPIVKEQEKLITKYGLETVWEIEKAVTPVFCKMIRYGVRLDHEVLKPALEEAKVTADTLRLKLQTLLSPHVEWQRIAKYDEMQAELDDWNQALEVATRAYEEEWQGFLSYAQTEYFLQETPERQAWADTTIDRKDGKPKGQKRYVKYQLKKWRENCPRPPKPKLDISPINLDSPAQLKVAVEKMGLDLPDMQHHTLKIALGEVDSDVASNIILPLLEYKRCSKLLAAFGEGLIAHIHEGKVHPQFRQYGTATGRISCSAPNVLQIPRDQNFRKAFRADDGYVFIVADYSQMELRLLAEMSQDPKMIKVFVDGKDLHTSTAQDMFQREDVTKEQRSTAKTVSLGIPYGLESNKLIREQRANGNDITKEEAQEIINKWRKNYATTWAYLQKTRKQAVEQGYTTTALGRRRNFVNVPGYKGAIERAGGNFPLQGGNADVSKLAMVIVDKLLEPVGGRVVLQVYDEIVATVPEEHAEYGASVVQFGMAEAARAVLKSVPVAVDCVVSRSWSEEDVVAIERDTVIAG